ncbi:PQQ-binding-like beta-propeller repeat protein [Rhodococcus sp. BS-15]|uniref:outer membrane protein assembly factor BamB family protein n=1 Tax=Rhodococcus sp. BS-15 TaxID=1304954 RepID=UPI000FFC1652|nr:PQQ-binding-like beta-propeller repeat protein [Rhodococcus sp. BS-15]
MKLVSSAMAVVVLVLAGVGTAACSAEDGGRQESDQASGIADVGSEPTVGWRADPTNLVGDSARFTTYSNSSPDVSVLDGGDVVIPMINRIYSEDYVMMALNRDSGEKQWEITLSDAPFCVPYPVSERLICVVEGALTAIDPATGETVQQNSGIRSALVAVDGSDLFVFQSDRPGYTSGGELLRVSAENLDSPSWVSRVDDAINAGTPRVAGGLVSVDGTTFDAETGQRLQPEGFPTEAGTIVGANYISKSRLYRSDGTEITGFDDQAVLSPYRKVFDCGSDSVMPLLDRYNAYSPESGEVLWNAPFLSTTPGTAGVIGGRLVAGDSSKVVAVDASTGQNQTVLVNDGASILGTDCENVLVYSESAGLQSIDPVTGDESWGLSVPGLEGTSSQGYDVELVGGSVVATADKDLAYYSF